MKIAIINRHRDDFMGGSELQCDLIAATLAARGHEVTYFVPDGQHRDYGKVYNVVRTEADKQDIVEKIIGFGPDVLYWRFNKNLFYPTVKNIRKEGIPVVFAASHINDLIPWSVKPVNSLKYMIRYLLKSRWNHQGFNYVDALTVNNREYLGKLAIDIQEYIPNGMDTTSVPFTWDKPFCAWIANIKKVKQPEIYIQLARELEADGTDFLMVGEIQQKEYQWLADQSDKPSNFHYLGGKSLEEVNGILAASEFHIHTCMPEGFPNVFIQAWLQKKPSVSYGFDPAGYISEQNLGFYSNNNLGTFTGQVRGLLENKKKRDELGENAWEFAREMFSLEETVNRIEHIFSTVIKKK